MKFFVFSLLILFVGCANNYKPVSSDVRAINIYESDLKKIKYQDTELIEDYYYTPLETIDSLNLIGKIDKVEYYNDKLYILDRNISKAVYVFSENGNYITKIATLGNGPGEFMEPQDFAIRKDKNQLVIYCKRNKKLLTFSLDGQFLEEERIGLNFRSFCFYREKKLFFSHSIYNYLDGYGELPFDFFVLNDQNKLINNQFQNGMSEGKSGVVLTHNMYFTSISKGIFLSWVLNDTIYKLTEQNEVIPFCIFNFGSHSVPTQLQKTSDEITLYRDVVMDGLYWSKYGPLVGTDELFIINISAGISNEVANNFYHVLFSGETSSKILFRELDIENDDGFFSFPLASHNNYFISVLYPEELLFIKESINDQTPVSLKGYDYKIRKFDNPILMFTKFRKI